MNKKKIIIISGKQFSGKDTVAATIRDTLKNFKIVPLAEEIKKLFGQSKNLTVSQIDRNKPLYRADLIVVGNKFRSQDPDYWINQVLRAEGDIIVPDVRLKHELDTFKKLGAVTIRVNSERDVRAHRGILVSEDDTTETDLDRIKKWDYVIENNDDVESLKEKAREIAESIEHELFSGTNK